MKIKKQIEAFILYLVNNKYNPNFKNFKQLYQYKPINEFYDYYSKNRTEELDFYHDLLNFRYGRKKFIAEIFNSSKLKKILNQ